SWPPGDLGPAGHPHERADARSDQVAFVVSARRHRAILPTWAKIGGLLGGIVVPAPAGRSHSARDLNLPFGQALATAREEDRHWMRRPDYLGTDLEEPLHQLHGFDVRHRREHVASEALAWRARLSAARERLKGLGHPRLEHSR